MHPFVGLTEVIMCLEKSAHSSELGGPDAPQPEEDAFFQWKQVNRAQGSKSAVLREHSGSSCSLQLCPCWELCWQNVPTKRASFRRALSFEIRAAAVVWLWLPSPWGASASLSQSPLLLSFAFQLLAKNATDRCRNASLSGREAFLCHGNPGIWEGLWGLTCPHDSSNKTGILNKLQRSAEDAVRSHLPISSTDTDGLILKVRPPMASQPPLLRLFCLATEGGCAAPVQPKSSRQLVGFPKSTPNFQTTPLCFPAFWTPRPLHPSLQMS